MGSMSQQSQFLAFAPVEAGFPAPSSDGVSTPLDLNELMIKHPAATFFVRIAGESMVGAGILPGDIAVVDRAIEATSGRIIIASLNGEFTLKRLIKKKNTLLLQAENPRFPEIVITPETDFQVWGVVTYVIHHVCPC